MALDPDLRAVIDAVPGWAGLEPEVAPLEAGITNRNFRVDIAGGTFVVRLAGRDTELLGIDRSVEHAAATAAAAAGVAPEVVAFLPSLGALVTRFVEAEPLPPERLEDEDVLEAVVASVRAIHGMAPLPGRFDAFRVVRAYRETAERGGVPIPRAYDEALEVADRIESAFGAAPMAERPCHNDLLNANLLLAGDRVVIVDYEYAGMGDPFFDLGNFSINNGISPRAQRRLIEVYFGEATPARMARLQLMRAVSDFREAMWGVVQQGISALDVDYVSYADQHFARCLATAGDDRFGGWLDAARGEA